MLDKWFYEDLKELFTKTNRVVVVDRDKQYDFLVDSIADKIDAEIFKVDEYLSDLEVKYTVEKEYRDENVLIHTHLEPSNKEKRQYMIQEYASTGRIFDRLLNRYIGEKSSLSNTEYNFESEELIVAGKMSLKSENNNEDFWQNIKIEGRQALLGDFIPTVLKFLDAPFDFVDSLPEDGKEILYQLLGEYLSINPDKKASPQVVADDFAEQIFDNIIEDKEKTEGIYRAWIDSHRYRRNLAEYLDNYELSGEIDIWGVSPNHPFSQIDDCWLEELSEIILSDEECPDYILKAIKERYIKAEGLEIAESYYWKPAYKLLDFQAKPAHKIEDINEFIELYKNKIYKLDQSIRHINQHLYDKSRARRAFQTVYEEKMRPYLNKWFELFNSYRENQSGYLPQEIFADRENKAVIVGDAIAFEVSQEIVSELEDDKDLKITNKMMSGDYPTTTAHNMSSLFGSHYSNDRSKREKALENELDNNLQIKKLEEIEADNIDIDKPTIIYTSDIDSISEKGDQAALKYYPTFIKTLTDKIKDLLDIGFAEVHLVTDHGFVCNFGIDEADKFSSPAEGNIRERYVLSDEYNKREDFIIKEDKLEGYQYTYYPKGINPVKSRSSYGFAHGGITPQEILLPHLVFQKESSSDLGVRIDNKDNLKDIASKNFTIKLKGAEKTDLFKQERDIILKIKDEGNEVFAQSMTIKPGEVKSIDISFNLSQYLIMVQDAESKQVIDSVKGEKENLRSGLDELDID